MQEHALFKFMKVNSSDFSVDIYLRIKSTL